MTATLKPGRHTLQLLFAGLVCLAVGPAFAQSGPVGLVTAVSGKVEPPLEPFSEIPPGSTLRMPDDGRITFLFYETCERITVSGGKLAFADNSFDLAGGRVIERKASPCPRKVTVHGDGTISGVLLRSLGGGTNLKLPSRPTFVFTGQGAKAYGTIQIARDGRTVFEAPLSGPEFAWPASAPALAEGAAHTLTLLPARPGSKSFRLDFTASNPNASGVAPVMVLRLE